MTKIAYAYYSVAKEGYILSKVLHKPPKGAYKRDLIYIEFVSDMDKTKRKRGIAMTPEEAIAMAAALSHAVVIFNNKKKKRRSKNETK